MAVTTSLAKIEYGEDDDKTPTVVVTFIVSDSGALPGPVDFEVDIMLRDGGDVAETVAEAKSAFHRLTRRLADQTKDWAAHP